MTQVVDDPAPLGAYRALPEGQRRAMRLERCTLVSVERVSDTHARCLFCAPHTPSPQHGAALEPVGPSSWVRCALPTAHPLVGLILRGGFYRVTAFGPHGAELIGALSGTWVGVVTEGFPEAYVWDDVVLHDWER